MNSRRVWWICTLGAWILGQSVRVYLWWIPLTPLDVSLLFGWFILLRRRNSLFHLKRLPWDLPMGLVILSMLVSIASALTLFPWNKVLVDSLYIVRFLLYLLPLYFFRIFPEDKSVDKLLPFFLGTTSGIGLAQLMLFPNLAAVAKYGWDPHWYRLVGTWLDPNYLGFALGAGIIYLLGPILTGKEGYDKKLLVAILLFIALLLTFSRSSYLAFGIMSLLSLVRIRKKETVCLALLGFLLMLLTFIPRNIIDKKRDIDRNESARARVLSWRRALKIGFWHPMGVGYNLFEEAQLKHQLITPNLISHGTTGSDSSLLLLFATTGVLGFMAWIFFLGRLLGWLALQADLEGWLLFSVLFGWIVHSQFVNSLLFGPLLFFLYTWIGCFIARKKSSVLVA